MKIIYEVGDRVELIDAQFAPDFLGATGTVEKIQQYPSRGTYGVHFVLDNPPENRRHGYSILCAPERLKYLGAEDVAGISQELRELLYGLDLSLREDGNRVLHALQAVADLPDHVNADTKPEVNRPAVELKKKVIAALKGKTA